MSKQIYVQAQADHIESLFKGTPLSAVEELVWNALDADANEVKVESRNLVYNGFARWSAGFTNWRHVLMGGSSDVSATTLL